MEAHVRILVKSTSVNALKVLRMLIARQILTNASGPAATTVIVWTELQTTHVNV